MEFPMTPFLMLVLSGYAVFMGVLAYGWLRTAFGGER
jgi:hypothetical protein